MFNNFFKMKQRPLKKKKKKKTNKLKNLKSVKKKKCFKKSQIYE